MNRENCCYINSVLVALFSPQTTFINNMISSKLTLRTKNYFCSNNPSKDLKIRKQIQSQLQNINATISLSPSYNSCLKLRNTISSCPTNDTFHLTDMNDASDLLQYILNIFDTKVATFRQNIYLTNNLTSEMPKKMGKIEENVVRDSVFIDIDALAFLPANKTYKTSKFLKFKSYDEDINVRERKIIQRELIDSPYIVFRFSRLFEYSDKFINTKITPDKNIGNLELASIIIYQNFHYTTYFKYDDTWYYYDDNTAIKVIGNYKNLLKAKPSVKSNGICYIYT